MINGAFDVNAINVPFNKFMTKIESVQYEAAAAITGTWQGTSRIKLYDQLGLGNSFSRANHPEYQMLITIYSEERLRTNRCKKSFLPDGIG